MPSSDHINFSCLFRTSKSIFWLHIAVALCTWLLGGQQQTTADTEILVKYWFIVGYTICILLAIWGARKAFVKRNLLAFSCHFFAILGYLALIFIVYLGPTSL